MIVDESDEMLGPDSLTMESPLTDGAHGMPKKMVALWGWGPQQNSVVWSRVPSYGSVEVLEEQGVCLRPNSAALCTLDHTPTADLHPPRVPERAGGDMADSEDHRRPVKIKIVLTPVWDCSMTSL